MTGSGDLYEVLMDRLNDPYIRGRIRRALAMDLVLDTWLNGEREESFTTEAQEILSRVAEDLTQQALESGAIFPGNLMPEGYVRSVFQELLSSTALYQSQKYRGVREVDSVEAVNAETILRRFVTTERDGLTSAGGLYFVISAHEDLNAIRYYRRMKREDFLLGTLHRPWSDMVLTNQLDVYLRMGLVKRMFTSEGDMLELTTGGEEMLAFLRRLLEEAGEFEWRSSAQRWTAFGELKYDQVFGAIFPDNNWITREFVENLQIPHGANVLEVGAGTGRTTCEMGLADKVRASSGTLFALEPSAALIPALREKCQQFGATNVNILQGVVEKLPFPNDSFYLTTSILVLHFTDVEKAISEMVRVTKPGGWVTAMTPLRGNPMDIPMVAAWFRPLQDLANELGVSLGERQGVEDGRVEQALRDAGVSQIQKKVVWSRVLASDYRAFLHFMLRGAAFYQNILSRMPFQERRGIIRLLEERGADIAARTTADEQVKMFGVEQVEAKIPELKVTWRPTSASELER